MFFLYKNNLRKSKVVFVYKNNLTNVLGKIIINIGDEDVKKRNVFKEN